MHRLTAKVGVPQGQGRPMRYHRVRLWMIGNVTLGTVGGIPRWLCNRSRRRAAWIFELRVLDMIANANTEVTNA